MKVFLSCAPEDRDALHSLMKSLEVLPYYPNHVWAASEIEVGLTRRKDIIAQIRVCDVILVALSPASVQSKISKRQRTYVFASGKPVIAIIIDEVHRNSLPAGLANLPTVDFVHDQLAPKYLLDALWAYAVQPSKWQSMPPLSEHGFLQRIKVWFYKFWFSKLGMPLAILDPPEQPTSIPEVAFIPDISATLDDLLDFSNLTSFQYETNVTFSCGTIGAISNAKIPQEKVGGEQEILLHPRVTGPDVINIGETFELEIGVSFWRDRALISTGPMRLPHSTLVELGLLVTYDPESLQLEGPTPTKLQIDTGNPDTTVIQRFAVLDGEDISAERRVGVHYLRDGVPIGIAWKTLLAVPKAVHVDKIAPPINREGQLIDLTPIVTERRPDLVVAVYRADDTDGGKYLWAAYPSVAGIAVPDLERSSYIGKDAQRFATSWRRTVETDQHPRSLFTQLHGMGVAIGRAIPLGIRHTLHGLATDRERNTAATVLLLTEEVHVPWELAAFKAPHALESEAGGESPFLGAHVAISRWPLTDDRPRPILRTAVEVRHMAVISAKYEGFREWGRIIHAEEEAAEILRTYPPATEVPPYFDEVMDCLNGVPPGEVLHFALHGKFTPEGSEEKQEGLVIFTEDKVGVVRQGFLTPVQVDAAQMKGAFVFLNACQVGASKKVLGDYAGFAVSFLRAGATGVVAPLWNIDDVIAGTVARDFYAMVYGPESVSAAEALRRIRARYTERAAKEASDTGGATFLAYQVFGHPGLTLTRLTSN